MWKPRQSAPAVEDALHQRRHARGIDPERLGAAAHPHARALDLEIGVDPDREPGPPAELGGDRQRALRLALGFDVEGDAGIDRLGKSASRLPGPAKLMLGRIGAGLEREVQLARRGDVEAVDLLGDMPEQRR